MRIANTDVAVELTPDERWVACLAVAALRHRPEIVDVTIHVNTAGVTIKGWTASGNLRGFRFEQSIVDADRDGMPERVQQAVAQWLDGDA